MYHWLIFNLQVNEIDSFFSNAPLNINSDVHLTLYNSAEKLTDIFDVYNGAYNHKGVLIVTKAGFYTKGKGYDVSKIENKYWKRRNMTGITFKSAIVVSVHMRENLGREPRDWSPITILETVFFSSDHY